uniref:Uncharacterized protein n=1 Tax=viral metagenome TaxID=1070528 RepID=A0A6C0I6V9_9ZZZZ
MMDNIIEPTVDYDFSKLYLGPPSTLAGGSYFTKILSNNNKLLYLQTPKSLTKQGFVKSGKKIFVDLMFDNNDTVFINWIENLETKCQELLFSKGDTWFQTKLEKDDIESAFTSAFKIYKSGKYYLLRVNVKPNIKIYNEANSIVNIEDITTDKNIISILEIQGIKFTARNFQIELELKQSMIVSPDPFLDECFIKNPLKNLSLAQKSVTNTPIINTIDDKKEDVDELNLAEFIQSSVNDINDNRDITSNTLTEIEPQPEEEYKINNKMEHDNTSVFDTDIDTDVNDDKIVLEIEELDLKTELPEIEDPNLLKEVDLNSSLVNSLETFTLKKPNQVYRDILEKARTKAKEAKRVALEAYLELKEIKKTYMIDDIDDSDSDLDMYSDDDLDDDESESI